MERMSTERVKAHQSHTKTGTVYQVRETTRNVNKKKVVSALAAKLLEEAKLKKKDAKAGAAPKATKAAVKGTKGKASAAVPKAKPVGAQPAKKAGKAATVAAPKAKVKAKAVAKAPTKPTTGKASTALKAQSPKKAAAIAPATKAAAKAGKTGVHVGGKVKAHAKQPVLTVGTHGEAGGKKTKATKAAAKPKTPKTLPGVGPQGSLAWAEPDVRAKVNTAAAPAKVTLGKPAPLFDIPGLKKDSAEGAAARVQKQAVFEEHLGKFAEKKKLEGQLFLADGDEAKQRIREKLKGYKDYTPELERRVKEATLRNMEPKIVAIAGNWMRKLGMTASVDEKGRPASNSFFADMAQHARMSAWQVIGRHDPTERITSLHDQVAGTVDQELSRKWRDIMGVSPIRVSQADNTSLTQMSRVRGALETELGRPATDTELAHAMQVETAEVKRLSRLAHEVVAAHLDAPAGDDDQAGTLGDLVEGKGVDPLAQVAQADHSERLQALMGAAIAQIPDPRARYAVVVSAGLEDGGKALKDMLKHEHVPAMAEGLKRAKDDLNAQNAEIQAAKSAVRKVPKDQRKGKEYKALLQAADREPVAINDHMIVNRMLVNGGVKPSKVNPNGQKYQLALNLLKWKGDYMAMLTTPKSTKDVVGGKKSWIAVSDVFERLGYHPGTGRKMLMNAKQHLQLAGDLQDFHGTELTKGLMPYTAEGRLMAFVFEDRPLDAEPQRTVKMWLADTGLVKSLGGDDRVWTVVDRANGLIFQMAAFAGPGSLSQVDEAIAKSYTGSLTYRVADALVAGVDEPFDDLILKGIGAEMLSKYPGGRWITMHGRAVYITKGGQIAAGPSAFVGKHISELHAHLSGGGDFGDHSHADDEKAAKEHKFTIQHEGKTVHVHVRQSYDAKSKKGHKTELFAETEHGTQVPGSKKDGTIPAAALYRHLGLDNKNLAVDFNKELDAAIQNSSGNDLSEHVAKQIAGHKRTVADGKVRKTATKGEKAKAAAEDAPVDFKEGAQQDDGTRTFTARTHDGHDIDIHIGADGRVKDQYWGGLLGDTVIHTADDLNRKLRALAGTSSVVHLSNGNSHWLMHVTYDHKGSPVITQGNLAGKRLHEIIGETGGLAQHQGPVEHNGKQLFAGYDAKQDKMTALGNWSREKAHAYFEAHTPEEKAIVDAKLADADRKAHADVPTIQMEQPESADERKARLKANKQRVKDGLPEIDAPEPRAILSLPSDPTDPEGKLIELANAMVKHKMFWKGTPTQAQEQAIIKELGEKHGLGGLEDANLGTTTEQSQAIRKAHAIAQVLGMLKEEGYGQLANAKGGKRGLVVPMEAVDRITHLLGGVKLRGDILPRLQQVRQKAALAADQINGFDELGSHVYGPEGKATTAIPGLLSHINGDTNGRQIGFTKHQQKMIHHYVNGGQRTISALGVGNGKTSSALAAAELAKVKNPDAAQKHLVVVPSTTQAKAWKDDAAAFFGMKPHLPGAGDHHEGGEISFGKDISPNAKYHVVTRSMLANKATRIGAVKLADVMRDKGLTHDDLHRPEVQAALEAEHNIKAHELFGEDGAPVHGNKKVGGKPIAQHLKEQGFDGVIVDEAHTLNRAGTQGGQRRVVDAYIHGLDHEDAGLKASQHGRAKGVMALTGTPIQNHLGEQLNLVNMTHRGQHDLGTEKQFIKNYGIKDESTGHLIGINEEKKAELGNKLSRYMVTSTNEDLDAEMRPPSAQLQDMHVDLGPEHDAMIQRHHEELHSSGAMSAIEGGGKDGKIGKGALAAIAHSEEELHAHKIKAVEDKVREIMRNDPHAKIILASKRVNGQNHLEGVAKRVMGEYSGANAKRHLESSLEPIERQMHEEATKHQALKASLQDTHDNTKHAYERHNHLSAKAAAGGLTHEEEVEHRNLKAVARAHADTRDRLSTFPETSNTYERLKRAHADVQKMAGGADADRLGYKYGVIRASQDELKAAHEEAGGTDEDFTPEPGAEDEETSPVEKHDTRISASRNDTVKSFNENEAHKILVVSSNIAASGVNLGRGTHLIDLDGDYNQANLEQLYGRHARLTGSVPKAIVHRVITRSHTAGVSTLDEKKGIAVARKQKLAGEVRQAARFGRVEGAEAAPARVKAQFMGKKRSDRAPGRTAGHAEPDLE
jgi:hypothetical protein